jgi:hypothetical protein
MTFKQYFKTYGLIGYPLHVIGRFIGRFTGNRIVKYDTLLHEEMAKYRKKFESDMSKLSKSKKRKSVDIDKLKRKIVNDYLSHILDSTFKTYETVTKGASKKVKDDILIKHRIVSENISEMLSFLQNNSLKDFNKKYKF